MKRKTVARDTADLAPLIAQVRHRIQSARRGAASVVNTLQGMAHFGIGRRIETMCATLQVEPILDARMEVPAHA